MDHDHSPDTENKESIQYKESTGHALTTIPTSVTLSPEQFEKLYLTPMTRRQPDFAKRVGNPTPLALGGFVITTTPISCCLMAWRGASGNGVAFIGPIVFLGGLLLLITSILEFILGNTFPCVVFGTIGGFWFAFAATMIPAFNAAAPYSASTTDTVAGLSSAGFMTTYAFLFVTMAVLMLIFMICATRTNIVYTLIFLTLLVVFLLLSSAYWLLAEGSLSAGNKCVKGAGASLFVASLLGFYLLIVQLFEALGFPFRLPVGDLAALWDRSIPNDTMRDIEESAAVIQK
ncbi:Putative GPR1/FUN34/YaaH-class plasma membrane protein [Penicillium brasilianum]|uniref:Putative GPR1/FUN34/YaaH-class plasma membrane protein n=1 Tax=Penicillium brasilianum TaxID=104259 RepID=A0A0F7TRX3_PENBI|nr:Putative GPR1/FUN34/YaaH-class plasma membrane protein [Penicillium brasilianum]